MSDFIPPFDGEFDSGVWGDGQPSPPGHDYTFVGYFYSGQQEEICQGIWLRDEAIKIGTDLPPDLDATINDALSKALDGFGQALLGIDKLVNEADVPEGARREATGYLTIGEANERGGRLPPGLDWGIYVRGGLYYLAIWGSG